MRHVQEPPQPLSERNPLVPAGLEAVVMRALAKDPRDRYQSADEMGIDEVHVSDHVAISQAGYDSKGGKFPYPVDSPGWYEPLASLSAIAAVTKRVRCSPATRRMASCR